MTVLVIAVGSPHGDDQAGWTVVERLKRDRIPGVKAMVLRDPLDLLIKLRSCRVLILVDACRTGAEPGTVVCLDPRRVPLRPGNGHSSHGLGLVRALALAEALGKLPERVLFIGVEAQAVGPGEGLSEPVQKALDELYRQVLAAVRNHYPTHKVRGGMG
jgi:hydrogenase maturation protease